MFFGLPLATQIDLEHEKNPKDYDHQPADPPAPSLGFDRGQRFNVFFLKPPLKKFLHISKEGAPPPPPDFVQSFPGPGGGGGAVGC